ncbi:MAG: glutathione S-transferase N-terminal domain-containing protein [Hydrogenophaga sp.]|uniref:glutathione S-transferase N-terminal domain-containing protein n=1 Tax=Hydrogenophaga sp. TaxID=1904254 RepID=UPI003D0F27EA
MNAIRAESNPQRSLFRLLGACLLTGLVVAPALAQGVYRIVGPDGKVSFSDQPPPAANAGSRSGGVNTPVGAGAASPLPFELRQVANRFPVTLYSSRDCAPCNSGRNLLNARGIPYTERTIDTAQDSDALRRLSGELSLPFLTIGGQQIKGYSDTEWTKFLDAAGYPRQSALPSNYRRPTPSPLVEVRAEETVTPSAAPSPSTAQGRPAPAPTEAPVAPPAQNPAGIRF